MPKLCLSREAHGEYAQTYLRKKKKMVETLLVRGTEHQNQQEHPQKIAAHG